MNRMTRSEDLMSSDDSDDDNYNYLTALDNLNWNSNSKASRSESESQSQSQSRPNDPNRPNRVERGASRGLGSAVVAKPAVAVKNRTFGNRTDGLLKDMIASERDKSKDQNINTNINTNTNTKTDNSVNCVKTKRHFDDFDDQQLNDLNDLTVFSDTVSVDVDVDVDVDVCQSNDNKNNNNNNINNNYTIPKNKKQKLNQTNQMTESEYSMEELLIQKKANHQKSVSNNNNNNNKNALNRVKNERLFGKAFSPTVYSPEVPVMRLQVPQTAQMALQMHRNSMTLNDENSLPDSKYNPNHILAVILDWNTKWLTEFFPNEVPPPLSPFGEGIGVKTCYQSLDEYQSAYIPLILFETWAQVYEDFNKNTSKRKGHDLFKAMVAPDYGSDDHFITISMQTVVPKNKLKSLSYASEGYLILMELFIDYSANNEHKKLVLFGYVSDYNVETITPNTTLLPGLVVAPTHTSTQLLLKYTVQISKKPIRISSREPVTVRTIHYLKPTMRQIELIAGLNTCPLFKDILRPRSFTSQVVVPTNVCLNTANFNEGQSRAILGSSEAVSRPYAVPKLLLIQGPPGTGKTHTLIGIIKQIYMKWDTPDHLPRILICAPSNGAVDEIARRLYSERRFLQKHKCDRALRCVRVGQSSQIHADVRRISLETLIEENADNEEKRFQTIKQKQTQELEARMLKLDQEMADLRASNRKNDLSKLELDMHKLMFEMTKVGQTPKPMDLSKSRLRMDLMIKADIVLSTLNSCHQSPIENLFRNFGPKTFDCVIVDEASQCSEPELLMPLAYRMTKMILIGDPMQLPATVISKKASSLCLGRSLFERFFHYFRECEQNDSKHKSPILMLTEQYRMHPQICEFPSKQFYDGRLTSSAKVIQNRDFKLKPYIVFDVTDTQESRTDPTNKYNESEANFVVRLVELIDQMMGSGSGLGSADSHYKHSHSYSIGIITPYNGQKNFLSSRIEDKKLKANVEVNTVDGFQGQERDIIILSCVRAFDSQNTSHANSIGFLNSVQRMNVALTRAKYSMIVCISGRSLESDKNWKSLIDNAMKRTNCRFKVPSTLASDKLKKMLERPEPIDPIEPIEL